MQAGLLVSDVGGGPRVPGKGAVQAAKHHQIDAQRHH
jgi:hypothetical protein